MQYDRLLLNNLLDSYERSLLSSGKNKVQIHIFMAFSRRNMPEYFDESSMVYEEIHMAAENMERLGFLEIQWKNRKPGTIIEKAILNEEKVDEVYQYLHRTPKTVKEDVILKLLQEYCYGNINKSESTITAEFIRYLLIRVNDGKSVKEYIDISSPVQTKELLDTLMAIEKNDKPAYIREFSIDHLGDSKKLENMLGLIGKVMRRFGVGYEEMDVYEILAEYQIYHTPNYVYIKGTGCLEAAISEADLKINLAVLRQGIAVSGEDIDSLKLTGITSVKKVITIENLTTFYSWNEPDSIIIYLGGYHNQVRQRLLQMIYKRLPGAKYLHFGDIDIGGFQIYLDLCRRTNIPFQLYHMGIIQLKKYEEHSKKLTENDNRRLDKMIEKLSENPEIDCCKDITEVLKYMKIKQLKLEQECQHECKRRYCI